MKYEKPRLEVIYCVEEDIITLSGEEFGDGFEFDGSEF